MIQEIQILEQLLEKYRLTEPVPEEVRAYFLKRKKAFFVKVCKSLGIYNIFFGSVITVFFIMKKLGIAVTVIQSAVIVTVLTVFSAASVTYCGYSLILPLIKCETKQEKQSPAPLINKEELMIMVPHLSLNAPALLIQSGSITESGTTVNVSLFRKDFISSLTKYYPRIIFSKTGQAKNFVNLHATLVKNSTGYDFYLRLSDTKGICFKSLQYHAKSLQGLYRQSKDIAYDIAEACTQ